MSGAARGVKPLRAKDSFGGDVEPNHMDAMCVLAMSKWLLSELVRLFHNVETDVASAAVDRLVVQRTG
jgi:hypothetical protein